MKQAQASGNTVLRKKNVFSRMLAQWDLQILLVPGILLVLLFSYVPMYGVVMGFQDFQLGDFPGFSQWVGFKHFQTMFADKYFGLAMRNTLVISALKMFIGFPLPIFFAVLLNEMNFQPLKKTVQTVSYLPHFLSWVVIAGIWISFLAKTGAVNQIRGLFALAPIDYMTDKGSIRWVLFFSEGWRSLGWDSIIYFTTILGISPSLYEEADIAGFDQVLNFTNAAVNSSIEILDTYIYSIGIGQGQYSLATAVGLVKGVFGVMLVLLTHVTSKRLTGTGVW